jgi:hypothetical protein
LPLLFFFFFFLDLLDFFRCFLAPFRRLLWELEESEEELEERELSSSGEDEEG